MTKKTWAIPTVADIANGSSCPNYWSKGTLQFFGQRRSDFRVQRTDDTAVFKTVAVYKAPTGPRGEMRPSGLLEAYWRRNAETALWDKVERPAQEVQP